MPPLLWAAVRFEFRGAAVALTLLALITVVFTISGASQFVGDPETQRQKQVMLQLFLAISAFSVLIVAAISRQHQQALLTLRAERAAASADDRRTCRSASGARRLRASRRTSTSDTRTISAAVIANFEPLARAAHRNIGARNWSIPKTLPRCSGRCGTVSKPATPP